MSSVSNPRIVSTDQGLIVRRQAGVALKHLPTDTIHHFHDANVPWQRVINAKGTISPRWAVKVQGIRSIMVDMSHRGSGGARRQAAFLRREGVTVGTGALGEFTVDIKVYGKGLFIIVTKFEILH